MPLSTASAKRTGHHEGVSTATSARSPEEPLPLSFFAFEGGIHLCPRRRCFLTGATNAVFLHQRRILFAFPTRESETKPNPQHCVIRHPHSRRPRGYVECAHQVLWRTTKVKEIDRIEVPFLLSMRSLS